MGPKKEKTPEQKLLLLEQKRLQEEEMERRKREILQQYFKNKTEKEEKISKLNHCKLQAKWREILREVKSKDLKEEIETMQHSFDRMIDHLNNLLTNTILEIEGAEEQQSAAFRSHLKNVDFFIGHQNRILKILQDQYDNDLEALKYEFEKERKMILEQHDKEIKDLQDIIYTMDYDAAEKGNDASSDFFLMMDDLKNMDVEDNQTLRVMLEEQAEILWNQMQQMTKRYNESTEIRNRVLDDLKMKDAKSIELIDIHMKKLRALQETINSLKNKLWTLTQENEKTNKLLKEERETLMTCLREMKNEMKKRHKVSQNRLVELSVFCSTAYKSLSNKIKLCEKVISNAESCRRMETEEEKIIPFYTSSLTKGEDKKLLFLISQKPFEKIATMAFIYTPMENFWKRYNKVLLEVMALEKEKSILLYENNFLQHQIKRYKIIPMEDVLNQTVKPLSDKTFEKKRFFVIPVLEATHEMKKVIAAEAMAFPSLKQ